MVLGSFLLCVQPKPDKAINVHVVKSGYWGGGDGKGWCAGQGREKGEKGEGGEGGGGPEPQKRLQMIAPLLNNESSGFELEVCHSIAIQG